MMRHVGVESWVVVLTLQKSMDLTPLEPRAGPTGGEGDAWPAPTMSFTIWSFWMALRAMMSAMAGREYSRWPHISSQTSSEHLLVRQLNLIWMPSFWARLHRVSAVSLSRSGDQSWRAKALPPRRLARAEECNGFRTCIIILCRSHHRLSSHAGIMQSDVQRLGRLANDETPVGTVCAHASLLRVATGRRRQRMQATLPTLTSVTGGSLLCLRPSYSP